jgi:hypothetical protein
MCSRRRCFPKWRHHATGEVKSWSASRSLLRLSGLPNLGVLITYPLIRPMAGFWTAHAVVLDKALLARCLPASMNGGLVALYLNGINSSVSCWRLR